MNYYPTYGTTDDGVDPNECGHSGPATLEEIVETCKALGVSAELRDEPGFTKGRVEADGNYRLS